ncbi:hypothetical protein FHX34_104256 [Actinoplanes teichomyceticus]|uniref:Uncharacterized protein n=1 Tax=Actinoplanes teichomyceticus TaxID=1867 RepID=A0A561VQS3_ACTTI|nr:hypothetical protein FHX34_104256 [Actinoplanes teichomyceticus]
MQGRVADLGGAQEGPAGDVRGGLHLARRDLAASLSGQCAASRTCAGPRRDVWGRARRGGRIAACGLDGPALDGAGARAAASRLTACGSGGPLAGRRTVRCAATAAGGPGRPGSHGLRHRGRPGATSGSRSARGHLAGRRAAGRPALGHRPATPGGGRQLPGGRFPGRCGARSAGRGTRPPGRGTRSPGRGTRSPGRGTRPPGRGTRSGRRCLTPDRATRSRRRRLTPDRATRSRRRGLTAACLAASAPRRRLPGRRLAGDRRVLRRPAAGGHRPAVAHGRGPPAGLLRGAGLRRDDTFRRGGGRRRRLLRPGGLVAGTPAATGGAVRAGRRIRGGICRVCHNKGQPATTRRSVTGESASPPEEPDPRGRHRTVRPSSGTPPPVPRLTPASRPRGAPADGARRAGQRRGPANGLPSRRGQAYGTHPRNVSVCWTITGAGPPGRGQPSW